MREIAAKAQCSLTVVSKVLNNARGSAGASEQTRKRVKRVAAALGYSPNYHARALQEGRSRTLGLSCRLTEGGEYDATFWGHLMRGVTRGARECQQDLLLVGPTDDTHEVTCGIAHLRARRIDALIVPSAMYLHRLQELQDAPGVVVFTEFSEARSHASVGILFDQGIRQAARHLAALGHKDVLWLGMTSAGKVEFPDREARVRKAAATAGMTCRTAHLVKDTIRDTQEVSTYAEDCRQQFARQLDEGRLHPLPTAIIALSERVSMGIIAALSDRNLRVPRDVSVITFDDFYASCLMPPLTVIRNPLEQVGRRAAVMAVELASKARGRRGKVLENVEGELVIRASTVPPAAR
jgi:DNA-binding LacI/PurR family transcriptional regulator